jgi:hypothetical protein
MRMWAVGTDAFVNRSREEMAQHARFLAKVGVNMVRIHTDLNGAVKGSKVTDVDHKMIGHIRRKVRS